MAITKFLPVGVHPNTPQRLSDGTPYGSFCCLSRAPDRTITERDLGVLRAFATLASEQIEASLADSANAWRSSDRIGKIPERDGGLRIVHQPIVALADGRGFGAESLARFPDAGERARPVVQGSVGNKPRCRSRAPWRPRRAGHGFSDPEALLPVDQRISRRDIIGSPA